MRLIDATPEVCEPYLYDHLDDLDMIAAQNAIDDMPTVDAVPVCRCKDCKNWSRMCDESYLGEPGWAIAETSGSLPSNMASKQKTTSTAQTVSAKEGMRNDDHI